MQTAVGLRNFHDVFAVDIIPGNEVRRAVTNGRQHSASSGLQILVDGPLLNNLREKCALCTNYLAHQRAPLSAKTTIFSTSSPPQQKLGGSWTPVTIRRNLLRRSPTSAIRTSALCLTGFEFVRERTCVKKTKSEF